MNEDADISDFTEVNLSAPKKSKPLDLYQVKIWGLEVNSVPTLVQG